MKNSKLVWHSLGHTVLIIAYVAAVAWIMRNSQKFLGPNPTLLAATAFLLLFILSAAVVGSLIFGRPAMLYLNGQKNEAMRMFLLTIGWLAMVTIAVLTFQLVK